MENALTDTDTHILLNINMNNSSNTVYTLSRHLNENNSAVRIATYIAHNI